MIDLYTAPTPNGHKVSCTLEAMELEYEIHVVNLMENETGISPGQACVFYSKNEFGDKVLGGGWIARTINKYLST